MNGGGAHQLTAYVYDQVRAKRREVLETLLHDDFMLLGVRGLLDRDAWIRRMVDESDFDRLDVQPLEAVVHPLVAVVTAIVSFTGTDQGEPTSGEWVVADVWQRRGVDWQLLSRTTFPASASG